MGLFSTFAFTQRPNHELIAILGWSDDIGVIRFLAPVLFIKLYHVKLYQRGNNFIN